VAASAVTEQRTCAEIKAWKASEGPSWGTTTEHRLSERQAGQPGREAHGYAANGEPFEEFNPRSAARLKHDRQGFGRNKASRGFETLKTPRNPGEVNPGVVASRHRKCCRERSPGEARAAAADAQLRFGKTPKRSRRSREVRDADLILDVAAADTGKPGTGTQSGPGCAGCV
jgi:hypothetical protein